jgi:hypothetical protein
MQLAGGALQQNENRTNEPERQAFPCGIFEYAPIRSYEIENILFFRLISVHRCPAMERGSGDAAIPDDLRILKKLQAAASGG